MFLYNFWGIVCLLLLYRTVENRQESIGRREGSAQDLEMGIELGSP